MDDLFVLVEDRLSEELSSGGFHGEFGEVVDTKVRVEAVVFAEVEQIGPLQGRRTIFEHIYIFIIHYQHKLL